MRQIDYRANPSHCGTSDSEGSIDYDHPVVEPAAFTPPMRDLTLMSYDTPDELTSYDRMAGHGEVIPGFSPELDAALAWERGGPDGSPP